MVERISGMCCYQAQVSARGGGGAAGNAGQVPGVGCGGWAAAERGAAAAGVPGPGRPPLGPPLAAAGDASARLAGARPGRRCSCRAAGKGRQRARILRFLFGGGRQQVCPCLSNAVVSPRDMASLTRTHVCRVLPLGTGGLVIAGSPP